MKVRESGMPEEAYWETLFDVPLVLDRLGVDAGLKDVVEFGCGYGTFTIPVARRIWGALATYDIDEVMVERTRQRAAAAGADNVVYVVGDVFADGFGGKSGSKDACLLFNILHCEEPVQLLAEGARVVRPGAAVLVIHWRYDPATPRGPSMEIRPRPEQIAGWAKETGLLEVEGPVIDLPPWHYGLRLRRGGKLLKLGLNDEQKKKLGEIENEARQKARGVLTPDQLAKLASVPDKPVTMMETCPMMKTMLGTQEGQKDKTASSGSSTPK